MFTVILALSIICIGFSQTASERGESMRKSAGGKFVCRTDLPEWYGLWINTDPIESSRENPIHEIILSNFTKVFECNVGVIAGYVRLGRAAIAENNLDSSYRYYQMAMIFIYTLRSKQRIPVHQEVLWNISTREILENIQRLKSTVKLVPSIQTVTETYDTKMRIGLVSICAYPPNHELVLAAITPKNRKNYASLHGYHDITYLEHPMGNSSNVCIQHSKLWLMRQLLLSGNYDWLMWLDCDSIIVNMNKSIESIIHLFATSMTGLLITEELLGLSSANWIIRNCEWSKKFLNDAFDIAQNQIPLFGDQDAMISLAIGRGNLDPRITIVPQNEFNAYDALNAYFMGSPGYKPGDLLVTFPQCKDVSCNALFQEAYLASEDRDYFNSPDKVGISNIARLRVFGPQEEVVALYNSN